MISPSRRYTTPDGDGNFTFYNLREGDYEVVIDAETLPEGGVLRSPARASVEVRLDSEANAALFEIGTLTIEKPVRMMIDQKIDLHDVVKTPHGIGGGNQ